MGGRALPMEMHTVCHLLKYDQSVAVPFSSYGGGSFQRTHKDRVQLNGLNGSRSSWPQQLRPAEWSSLCPPQSQGARRNELFFKRPFGRPVFLSEQRRNRHFHLLQMRACYGLKKDGLWGMHPVTKGLTDLYIHGRETDKTLYHRPQPTLSTTLSVSQLEFKKHCIHKPWCHTSMCWSLSVNTRIMGICPLLVPTGFWTSCFWRALVNNNNRNAEV